MKILLAFLLISGAAHAQPFPVVGAGQTTAYYVDWDGDGCGPGKRADDVYMPLGFNPPPYIVGDTPDADDTDPTICTTAQWVARYGTTNAGMVTFLNTRKAFANTARIFYVSLTGNNSTGVVNDPTHPFRDMTTINTPARLQNWRGGAVILRGGTYTDVDFTYASGSIGHPLYIMAYPGEVVLLQGNNRFYLAPSPGAGLDKFNAGYTTVDGISFASLIQYYGGLAFSTSNVNFLRIVNCELAGYNTNTFTNHTVNFTVERSVFHDHYQHVIYVGSSGTCNQAYYPGPFDFADDDLRYIAGTSEGAHNHVLIQDNVFYNNGASGFGPIHMNGCGHNITIQRNFVGYSGAPGVDFERGICDSIISQNVLVANATAGIAFFIYDIPAPATPTTLANSMTGNVIEYNTIYGTLATGDIRGKSPYYGIEFANGATASDQAAVIANTTINGNVIVIDPSNHATISTGLPIFWFGAQSRPDLTTMTNNVLYHSSQATPTFNTMLLSGNAVDPAGNPSGQTYYNYSQFLAYGFAGISGNTYADPLLVASSASITPGLTAYNLRVSAGSPAIDRGGTGPATDITGRARVGASDAGAYEFSVGGRAPHRSGRNAASGRIQ